MESGVKDIISNSDSSIGQIIIYHRLQSQFSPPPNQHNNNFIEQLKIKSCDGFQYQSLCSSHPQRKSFKKHHECLHYVVVTSYTVLMWSIEDPFTLCKLKKKKVLFMNEINATKNTSIFYKFPLLLAMVLLNCQLLMSALTRKGF